MSTVRFGIVQQSNVVARASRRTPAAEPLRPAVVPVAQHGPRLVLTTVWVTVFATAVATAEPPEIAHVHPDYPTAGPRIVTGEGFPRQPNWTCSAGVRRRARRRWKPVCRRGPRPATGMAR